MRGWVTDLRHVLRGLRAHPTFTIVAIASLAIGIGANVAIFSVIRTLLLEQLPVPRPHELVLMNWHQPGVLPASQMNSSGGTDPATGLSLRSNVSFQTYEALRANVPAGVEAVGFAFVRDYTLAFENRSAILAPGVAVDGDYFRVLGVPMAVGRGITPTDDRQDAVPVVVISAAFHRRMFGGDPAVVGRTLQLNGVSMEVVGVTADGFRGLSKGGFFPQADFTMPLRLVERVHPNWIRDASLYASDRHLWVRVLARVPDETRRETLRQQWAAVLSARVAPFVSSGWAPPTVFAYDGSRGLDQTSPETRRLLFILLGVVGLVLLMACVNLAGLLLARGAARQRELRLRIALGASRWQLVRHHLVEGVVLATGGGAVGLLLTFWSRGVLTNVLTAGLGTAPMSRHPLEVTVDITLVAATLAISFVVALLFSSLPAWRLSRTDGRMPRLVLNRALVAVQVALTVPLLVCAGLFLRTVSNLGAVDIGFDPEGLSYFRVNTSAVATELADQSRVYQRVLDAVRAVNGVTHATLMELPLLSGVTSNSVIMHEGQQKQLYINAVGSDMLDTVGLRLIAGRMPGDQDGPDRPSVGVLNQTAARSLFGDQSPIGRTVTLGRSTAIEIVGVVSDARYDRQRADVRPTLYPSALQRPGFGGHQVVVRSRVPVAQLEAQLRQAVTGVHRDLPVPEIHTQLAQMRETTMRERVFAQLLGVFGAFVLLLSCLGLHGVTAFSVARRTSEIGIRLALGAQREQVLWLVMRQVAALVAVGLCVGVPLALWAGPLFEALLYGVAPADLWVLGASMAGLLVVALTAGWLPAWRASRLDPLKALKTE
jgi:predicted permease